GKTLGFLPLFQGPPYGVGMLAAGIILAIMIVPYITAVSREGLMAVPNAQREAALALGATRWETTRIAVLRYGPSGLVGAILLGLGRALGETMAVTMVIGNRPEVAVSLFAPGYTMASVIANEFAEATSELYLAALIEIGLLLFIVTVVVNALARLLVWSVGGPVREVRESPPPARRAVNVAMSWLAATAAGLVVLPLLLIFGFLLWQGASAVNVDFFTHLPRPVGEVGGGMANAIVGTLILL